MGDSENLATRVTRLEEQVKQLRAAIEARSQFWWNLIALAVQTGVLVAALRK